jgi:hypothetical protein
LCGARGDQAVVAGDTVLSGLHEHEAARAIGILGQSGGETGLAKKRALLVAGHAAYHHRGAEELGFRLAEAVAGRMHFGQHGARDVEQRQQFVIPLVAVDVEEQACARRC